MLRIPSTPESLDRNSDAHGGEGDTRPPDPRRSRHLLRSKLLQRPRSASENGSRSTTSSVRIRVWTTNRPTRHTVETAVPVLRFPSTRRRRRDPQNRTPYIRCKPDKNLGDHLSRSAARGRRSGDISLGGESTRGVDRLSLRVFRPGEPPMHLLLDAQLWASLLTLTALEIVLGIDNLIFISIVSGRLPANRQRSARRIGLALAVITRLLLLAAIAWLVGLTQPLFPVRGHSVSLRDIILAAGGLFLLAKGTAEIHATMEGVEEEIRQSQAKSFRAVIAEILLLDIVFSLDSVITAVGMARHLPVK